MPRFSQLALALVVTTVVCAMAARLDGVAFPAAKPARPVTPDELAVQSYNTGIEARDRALKAEAAAVKGRSDAIFARTPPQVRTEYLKAFASFKKAAELNPTMPQAWNAMGFVYRKLGEYEKALESYERALALSPNFPDAIEYRGEAFLALNRIEDAKQAYLQLFAIDRRQAELLMNAMGGWVKSRRADPAGVEAAAIRALEEWIAERAALAQQTRLMAPDVLPAAW